MAERHYKHWRDWRGSGKAWKWMQRLGWFCSIWTNMLLL